MNLSPAPPYARLYGRGDVGKEFGELVRRLRREKGYSQEEFAFKVGLHQTYVSSADRLAKALGTTLAGASASG